MGVQVIMQSIYRCMRTVSVFPSSYFYNILLMHEGLKLQEAQAQILLVLIDHASTFILTELFISGMPFHQLTPPNPTLPSKDR